MAKDELNTDKGGLLVGKTDRDGGEGIVVQAPEGEIRMGGGEVIINEEAAKLNCEELSRINQSTGGVAIPCGLQKTANKGKFDDGGKINNNINLKIKEDEIRNIISGKSETSDRNIIQTAANFIRTSLKGVQAKEDKKLIKHKEEVLIRTYSRHLGLWKDTDGIQNIEPVGEGVEQTVYMLDKKNVIKLNTAFFYETWQDYLNSLLLHNYFFPDTAYELLGFTENTKGKLCALVKQAYISTTTVTDLKEVQKFLHENGFIIERNNNYSYPEAGLILEDLHDENVLTKDGILYFIDTVFFINKASKTMNDGGKITDEQKELTRLTTKAKELQESIDALYEKRRSSKEMISEDERKQISEYSIEIRRSQPKIRFFKNKIKAIENGGALTTITDKRGVIHENIPDFRTIDSSFISFDEETILDEPTPIYIPEINVEKFTGSGFVFDAIRTEKDTYVIATNGYIEWQNVRSNTGDKKYHPDDIEQGYVIVTLDQLALINEYYFTRERAIINEKANKDNKRMEEQYFKLPLERRQKHFEQQNYYAGLPSAVKKKITKEEWDKLTLEQKEGYYLPIKRVAGKRLTSKLYTNEMYVNFHDMYERFINPEAMPLLKKDKSPVTIDQPRPGYMLWGNEEVFVYWREFTSMMKWKLLDLKVAREVQSETRKIALETSFGDANIDDVLKQPDGIYVKRQDGSQIKPVEIDQIRDAWQVTQKQFGALKSIANETNLKISHTGIKNVFASKASGMYVPEFRTIAVSNKYGNEKFQQIMAHETAHFIDHKIGETKGKRFATDDFENTAGVLASTFRKHMNKTSDSEYINATTECFARAMEQYFAIETFGEDVTYTDNKQQGVMTYVNAEHYVNLKAYNERIKPLIQKFLSEIEGVFSVTMEVGGELKTGIKIEQEHENLYNELKNRLESEGVNMPMSKDEFFEKIASTHLKEKSDYYDLLKKYIENNKTNKNDNTEHMENQTENFFYLKKGNVITEWHNGAPVYKYEIVDYKTNADDSIVLMVKEHTITKGKITTPFEIIFPHIVTYMDSKHYTIEDRPYENDRDKELLLSEIERIKLTAENSSKNMASGGEVYKANDTSYYSHMFSAKGNDWRVLFAWGKSNYVSVTKLTNNPFGTVGRDFNNVDEAIAHYKTPEMKAQLIYAESEAKNKGYMPIKASGGKLSKEEIYLEEIKSQTGLRKDAIKNYITENNLFEDDVLKIVVGLGRKQITGVDVSVAITGEPGNIFSEELLEFIKSNKALKKEVGGIVEGWEERKMTGGRRKLVKEVGDVKHEIIVKADGTAYVTTTDRSKMSGPDKYSQTVPSDVSDDFNSLEEAIDYADKKKMSEGGKLRSVKVTYDNGKVIETNMAAHLTDQDIKDYYRIGRPFNIGSGENDKMAKVASIEIEPQEMSTGGEIKNQYNGKTPKQVWSKWTPEQRRHFMIDHYDEIFGISLEVVKGQAHSDNQDSLQKWDKEIYSKLNSKVKSALDTHIEMGQFNKGGKVEDSDYVSVKGKEGVFYIIGIHEGDATIKKVGDSKMSYIHPVSDLVLVQKGTKNMAQGGIVAKGTMNTEDGEIIGKVVYNDYWKKYQVNIDGVIYGEHNEEKEAIKELEDAGFKNVKKEMSSGGNLTTNVQPVFKAGEEDAHGLMNMAKGGNIKSMIKHWEGMPLRVREEYAEYLGNRKKLWNKREITLSKPDQEEIIAYQTFIHKNNPEFDKYLTTQPVNDKMDEGGNINELCPTGTTVQTLIFDRKHFSKKKASEWAKEHGFKNRVEITENSFRTRQIHPRSFKPTSFKTTDFDGKLPEGIQAVIGCLRSNVKIKK